MRVCVEYCRHNISIYCSDLWYKWFSCDNLEHLLKSGAEIYVTVTWVECCVNLQTVFEVTARFVTPWMSLLLFVLFVVLVGLVPIVMWFSASEMCVSWGSVPVGGCSACLPVPHSSSTTSHSHIPRGEESLHTSPAHSDPVVHSPRRSELDKWNTNTHTYTHTCFYTLVRTGAFPSHLPEP